MKYKKQKIYYFLIIACMLMTQWPFAAIFGDRIYPLIFGFPYSVAWCIFWICAAVVVSLVAAVTNWGYGDKESAE